MKKHIYKPILVMILLIGVSCTDDLTSLNVNPKAYQNVPGSTFFSNATRDIADNLTWGSQLFGANAGWNFKIYSQQFAEATYFDASSYNLANPGNAFWVTSYYILRDLKESRDVISKETNLFPQNQKNKLAIIDMMEVYLYSMLVNTYGNIPYAHALNGSLKSEALDTDNLQPAYDDAAAIYDDLFARLDKDIADIAPDANAPFHAFGPADLLNEDNMGKWKKFGYSLKLRMAMTLAAVNPAKSKAMAEAAAPNVYSSNDDNAIFTFLSANPNTNQVYVNLIQSGREDFVASNTMMDLMKAQDPNDPRIGKFYTEDRNGNYTAGTYGRSNAFANFSHAGDMLVDPTAPAIFLDYAEVEFFLAEAAARGYSVGGTAQSHYDNAIKASFESWTLASSDASAYLARPTVAFATATGTSIQKIARQKYIAMFGRGHEAWTEQRRLDFPVYNAPPIPNGDFPTRLTYPNAEQTSNGANYATAASAIGGDALTTKVFWDKF